MQPKKTLVNDYFDRGSIERLDTNLAQRARCETVRGRRLDFQTTVRLARSVRHALTYRADDGDQLSNNRMQKHGSGGSSRAAAVHIALHAFD